MPSSDGMAALAAARVSSTRGPRAPAGARSLGRSTSVSTPRQGWRLGCADTAGISIAMDESAICIGFMNCSYRILVLCFRGGGPPRHTCKRAIGSERRQAAHGPDFVYREHAVAQQNLFDLRFLEFITGVEVGEDKFQIAPTQFFCDGIASDVLREKARRGHDGGLKRLVAELGGGGAVHVVLQ